VTLDPAAYEHLLDITGGDPEFVDELIDTFIDDAVGQIALLRAGSSSGDLAEVVRAAHSLKSGSASVGATALSEMGRTIEFEARSGPVADLAERIGSIDREFDAVRAALLAARDAR
jgi:HPt (histidine-containing phosphotransfer) domain-containing protein